MTVVSKVYIDPLLAKDLEYVFRSLLFLIINTGILCLGVETSRDYSIYLRTNYFGL